LRVQNRRKQQANRNSNKKTLHGQKGWKTSNSLIENQDGDVNLQVTFGDILTCHMLDAFKSADFQKSVLVIKDAKFPLNACPIEN
jgi:hypothetical protein